MAEEFDPSMEVVAAARAVAAELRRFAERARLAEQCALQTGAELNEATRELHEVVRSDERLEAQLATLAAAVARARQWKQTRAIELAGLSLRVVERTAQYEQLLDDLRRLQDEADAAPSPRASQALSLRARALLLEATGDGWVDLAERARALVARLEAPEQHASLF